MDRSIYQSHEHEQIRSWRIVYDLFLVWWPIVVAIGLCVYISYWFLPLAVLVIGNRQYAMSILGHESLHGLINKNPKVNDFIGRYICYFPILGSLSRYRTVHLLHHRIVGKDHDPDRMLYGYYPISFKQYIKMIGTKFITGGLLWDFLIYFSEVPTKLQSLLGLKKEPQMRLAQSDFKSYFAFQMTLALVLTYFQIWPQYLIFWFLPLYLVFPLIHFQSALHHGAIEGDDAIQSRSFIGLSWAVAMIMPMDLNYHLEHHLNDRVPHYNLPDYSLYFEKKGFFKNYPDFRRPLDSTLKAIFKEA